MNRQEKESLVIKLKDNFLNNEFVAITHNHGLKVSEIGELRSKIFEIGDSSYKVAKNTLLKIAIKDSKAKELSSHLEGPTALAFSNDPVALSKIIVDFMKDHEKLIVIAGFLNGKLLSDKEVEALSKMPSLLELQSQIVHFVQSCATEIRRVLLAPAIEINRLLTLISPKGD